MTVTELVDRFAELALQQDKHLLRGEIGSVNRLYDQIEEVKMELKDRTGDQRRALIALYDHQNPQVRVKAAKATLAVAPDEARALLQAIADSREQPQALDAGMCLLSLDRGVFKPT